MLTGRTDDDFNRFLADLCASDAEAGKGSPPIAGVQEFGIPDAPLPMARAGLARSMPDFTQPMPEPASLTSLSLPIVTTTGIQQPRGVGRLASVSAGGAGGHNPQRPCGGGPYEDAAGARNWRKRGIPDLEQELFQLTARFKQLSQVNGVLRTKLKALERVLPYKDKLIGYLAVRNANQLGVLPAGAPPYGSQPSRQPFDFASISKALDSVARAYCGSASPRPAPADQPPVSSHSRCAPPGGSGAQSCPSRPGGQASHGLGPPLLRLHGGAPAVLALCPDPDGEMQELSPKALEQLRGVTPAEFRLLWKHMCMQTGMLVTSAEALGPASPQHARLERFLERVNAYMSKVVLLSPLCYRDSQYINLETGQHERPDDNFWAAIGASLQFSPEQLREVDSLYAGHEQGVARVLRERSELVQQLSPLMLQLTCRSHTCLSNDVLETFSAAETLAEQLGRNTLRAYLSYSDTGGLMFRSVLTPVQFGKLLAASYPYIPDGVAIMRGVRVAAGAPQVGPVRAAF